MMSSFGWCTQATASLTFLAMSSGAAPIGTSAQGVRPSLSSIAATSRCRSEPGWPDLRAARSTRDLILAAPTGRDPRPAMPVCRRTAARPAATVMSQPRTCKLPYEGAILPDSNPIRAVAAADRGVAMPSAALPRSDWSSRKLAIRSAQRLSYLTPTPAHRTGAKAVTA